MIKTTSAELAKKIAEFNQKTLPAILQSENQIEPGFASVVFPSDGLSSPFRRDFCGITKAYRNAGGFVSDCLTLSDGRSVAVGAVIDSSTEGRQEDLPVVLAVGINYGQGNYYISNTVPIFDKKMNMRPRLNLALDHLTGSECTTKLQELGGAFHLVAANFFPWVTTKAWSAFQFNGIEEATLIHCCGHQSPTDYIQDLIDRIAPVTVVFHGANNAVPYLGGCVYREALEPFDLDTIFCDNLAHGRGMSNSIKLKHGVSRTARQSLPYSAHDE